MRSQTGGAARRDIPRAILACLALSALLGIALVLGGGSQVTRTATTAQVAEGDDDLTTGSIVFVPVIGNRCRKRLIDNATWHIRDDGEVDCSTALAESADNRPHWSAARVSVIRKGFRKQ